MHRYHYYYIRTEGFRTHTLSYYIYIYIYRYSLWRAVITEASAKSIRFIYTYICMYDVPIYIYTRYVYMLYIRVEPRGGLAGLSYNCCTCSDASVHMLVCASRVKYYVLCCNLRRTLHAMKYTREIGNWFRKLLTDYRHTHTRSLVII